MKHNQNADTFLLLLLFTKSQHEKNWKNIPCKCRRSKKVKNDGFLVFWISSQIHIYIKYVCLTFNW